MTHISEIIEDILVEWAYRVHDGMPNPKNAEHIHNLRESMEELNLPNKVIYEVIQNLINEEDDDKYVSIGYGRYKEKGKEKDSDADVYVKDDRGRYIKSADQKSDDEKPKAKQTTIDPNPYDKKDTEDKPDSTEKTKELRDDANPVQDFNENESFTQTGISDEEFENNPNVEKNSKEDFKFSDDEIKKFFGEPVKFPKRYIKTLERLMSIKNKGNISITDVVKDVGAGELQAQAGEILTMMGSTIKDPKVSKELFDKLREHAENAEQPIIPKSWIDSAEKVRDGINKRLDATYGKGKWEITSSSWDVEGEVESLGMQDYKRDKGFSTDMYMVINGEDIDEVSLKKDLNANLLNATTGRVLDIIIQGNAGEDELKRYNELILKKKKSKEEKQELEDIQNNYKKEELGFDESVDVKQAQQRQRTIHDETLGDEDFISEVKGDGDLTDDEVKEIAAPMGISTKDKQKVADFIKNVAPKLLESEPPLSREKIKAKLKELGLKNGTRDVGKAAIILMKIAQKKNPNSKAAKGLEKAIRNSEEHSKSVANLIIKSPEVRKGILKSIKESLPLGALIEGEESMHLSEQSLDQEVLSTIFGVSSMDELVPDLTLNEEGDAIVYQIDVKNPDPPPEIVKENIPIAVVKNRPDGKAYGETWKLEFKIHPQFKKEISEANKALGRTE